MRDSADHTAFSMMGQLYATFGDNLAILQNLAIKRGGQPFSKPIIGSAHIIKYAAVNRVTIVCVKICGVNAHFLQLSVFWRNGLNDNLL